MNQSLSPLPQEQQDFCHYFNCGKYFIYQTKAQKWLTETRFIASPRTLWRRYKSPEPIGIRFEKETNFFVIDVDAKKSEYHYHYDPLTFYQLIESLAQIGIKATIQLQSTDSGGIHIFGFLPEKVNSYGLACALKMVLTLNNFTIAPGQLEIFPNPKPYNPTGAKSCGFNAIRLPLQPGTGSKLYNSKMRLVNGGIKKLLRLANKSTQEQNMGLLKNSIVKATKWQKQQSKISHQEHRRRNYQLDLEVNAMTGWTDYGQTNEILKSIANYGWVIKDCKTPHELQKFIIETAITLPGYQQYCQHKHEIELRAKHWSRSACNYWEKKWNYPQNRNQSYQELVTGVERQINAEIAENKIKYHHRYQQINQKRQSESQIRLKKCIAAIGWNNLPVKVGECLELLIKTSQQLFQVGFSLKTLKKPENRRLWQKKKIRNTPSLSGLFTLKTCSHYLCSVIDNTMSSIKSKVTNAIPQAKVIADICDESPQKSVVQVEKVPKFNDKILVYKGFQKKDPTMKFFVHTPQTVCRVFVQCIGIYQNLLSKYLQSEKSNSLELNRKPKALKVGLESLTSREKNKQENRFEFLIENLNKTYIYHGPNTRLISVNDPSQNWRLITGTTVRLSSQVHSTQLRENPEQIQAYVFPANQESYKPIAVPIEYLEMSNVTSRLLLT